MVLILQYTVDNTQQKQLILKRLCHRTELGQQRENVKLKLYFVNAL